MTVTRAGRTNPAGKTAEADSQPQHRVVLVVLDGWGYSPIYEGNAIAQANLPTFDRLWKTYPHTLLQAAGEAVGLPWGEMGNSEVGHLNIGAGRVVPQELPRISKTISDGSFSTNQALVAAGEHVTKTRGALHLIGLVSTGGVHSHVRHLYAILKIAKTAKVKRAFIHLITDGRDAPTKAALSQVKKVESELAALGLGQIASVSGRYYAMDRDHRWDRTKLAYEAMAEGQGPQAPSAAAAIATAYENGLTDEFIVPTVVALKGQPLASLHAEDAAIFFNFRPDRMRQLTAAFTLADFKEFDRRHSPAELYFVTMTEYEKSLPVHVAFHPIKVEDSLAKIVSDHGLRQFHIAETEKYPHATFFLNGGYEEPFPLEERVLVPSPKVATYDQEPAMSAGKVTEELVAKITAGRHPFIMVNYANADMVGHTGNLESAKQAVETVDDCLAKVVAATDATGSFLLVTADHGNAEQMLNLAVGEVDTEHTTNPVPFILVIPAKELPSFSFDQKKLTYDQQVTPTGLLGDVAPTVLKLLGITPPVAMEGYGLL